MAELDVITWLWGDKYSARDVVRLANACERHLSIAHRFHVFLERPCKLPARIVKHDIFDRDLIGRGCFCRLRMFDPAWQLNCGFRGTIVSLDLDLVILSELDRYFAGPESFMILQGVNAVNPNPFNASIMRLKAGHHAEVWDDFSLEAASTIAHHEFPDDQGWIWHKLPDAKGWKAGSESGIYGFKKPGWPEGSLKVPKDARIVAFIGKRKPQMYWTLPWIKQHWTDAA